MFEVQFRDGVWAKFNDFGSLSRAMKCIGKQLSKQDHLSEWRIVHIDESISLNGRVVYEFNKYRTRKNLQYNKFED